MDKKNEILSVLDQEEIESKIYTIRNQQVILDRDLSKLFEVTTKVLNQAAKRNKKRFPCNYMFQLTKEEVNNLRSQFVTANISTKSRTLPFVFTEHGVSQLSSVLNSDIAIEVSIKIIDAFIAMRKFLTQNGLIFQRLSNIEQIQLKQAVELDYQNTEIQEQRIKINELFKILDNSEDIPKQKVYFENQIYDAYELLTKMIKKAQKSIVIVDNWIDDSIFTVLTKRQKNVQVKIYTRNITKQLKLDLEKHNSQYPKIDIQKFNASHDRFMIIDNKDVYHFGASLKDLGKKWFGFFKVEKEALQLIQKISK